MFQNKTRAKAKTLKEVIELYNYGLFLLSLREYSRQQVRKKMLTRIEPGNAQSLEYIETSLDNLEKKGYLSDESKAQSLYRRWAKRESGAKLMQRFLVAGIAKEMALRVIADNNMEFDDDHQMNQALEQLRKKFKTYDVEKKDKYYRFLLSKGYSIDTVRKSLDLWVNEEV